MSHAPTASESVYEGLKLRFFQSQIRSRWRLHKTFNECNHLICKYDHHKYQIWKKSFADQKRLIKSIFDVIEVFVVQIRKNELIQTLLTNWNIFDLTLDKCPTINISKVVFKYSRIFLFRQFKANHTYVILTILYSLIQIIFNQPWTLFTWQTDFRCHITHLLESIVWNNRVYS